MVSVENGGDKDNENKKADEFGAEIIRIFAIIVAVVQSPEKGRGNGNLDMLPGRFVYCSKETNRAMFASKVVEKMSKSAGGGDNNNTEPHDKSVVHKPIIT